MAEQSLKAFKQYCADINDHYSSEVATELTYRGALATYIESFGSDIRARNEASQKKTQGEQRRNKPDFLIEKRKTPLGYIETKDIGKEIDALISSEQIQRYCKSYPNLIVTDYLEFRRYVRGELRSRTQIGKFHPKKGLAFFPDGQTELKKFFEEFLLEETPSVTSPGELASRLAHLTRQVKRIVRNELKIKEDSLRLHKLMTAFQKVLLADMDAEKFSDMFAQTLAYGFFAARVHFDGHGEFSRKTASAILPKTNPFLRKIFAEFANESLPDSLIGAVDDIVELLRKTDVEMVLKHFGQQGRQDPVVHFYESFLGAYDPNLKKSMGVYYTPDPVVSYMVRSLDEVLTSKFNRKKGLADDKTLILDPALGTGSFLHKVIEHIHSKTQKGVWDSYVSTNLLERIFGFEILMAPYAVAHLNLGLQLQNTGYTFQRDQRLGVFLTNTLEETAKRSDVLFSDWLAEEATAAASVKRDKPIMVVTGNPPYAAASQNDGEWIRELMRGYDSMNERKCANYYECDGQPLGERNPKPLNDDYAKFIRFAHWRIEQTGHGVLAFITNHGFLNNPTFRGMRESLMVDFDEIYILDLHGNSKRKEFSPDGSKDENVFDIQTGVSVNFFVRTEERKKSKNPAKAKVYRADLFGLREDKFEWLLKNSFSSTEFEEVKPERPIYLFTHQDHELRREFELGKKVTEIFPINSVGFYTGRDALTVQHSEEEIWSNVRKMSEMSVGEAREHFDLGPDTRDWRVEWAIKDLNESGPSKLKITPILYRPFDTRFTYYTGQSRGFLCMARGEVMTHMLGGKNLALITARSNKSDVPNHFFVSATPSEQKAGESTTNSSIFPLYVKKAGKVVPNLSPDILEIAKSFSKEDPEVRFFEYCYAHVHSPSFRERYKEFLKLEFSRIQIVSEKSVYLRLAKLGRKLIDIHLLQSDVLDGGKTIFSQKGSNVIEKVRYDSANSRVYINSSQYFENVPKSAWDFEIGGYQMLYKWLKDRKGEKLGHKEIGSYERIVEATIRTLELMLEIDVVIKAAGSWPIQSDQKQKTKAA